VYASEFNKESYEYLRWGMTLPEFSEYRQLIEIASDVKTAAHKDFERESRTR
jgi:tRNA G37 N-methylase Trm5